MSVSSHGQSHIEAWIEIGYTISAYNLLNINPLTYSTKSTIGLLGTKSVYSYNDLIRWLFISLLYMKWFYILFDKLRGNVSLGGIMQNKYGLKVVPSPNYPSPGK